MDARTTSADVTNNINTFFWTSKVAKVKRLWRLYWRSPCNPGATFLSFRLSKQIYRTFYPTKGNTLFYQKIYALAGKNFPALLTRLYSKIINYIKRIANQKSLRTIWFKQIILFLLRHRKYHCWSYRVDI